ncbi:transmembrane protein [Novosphingobium gossypii]
MLASVWFQIFSRVVLTSVLWIAGLVGIFDFPLKVGEMRSFGLVPAEAFAVAVTAVQLGGSLLIILNRYVWLGAGALGVFLALTIPIAHPFWALQEPQRSISFFTVLEHISLIGGLMVVAILAPRPLGRRQPATN